MGMIAIRGNIVIIEPYSRVRPGHNRFRPALGAVERLEPRQLLSVSPPVPGPTFHIADTVTNDWYSPSNRLYRE